VSGRGRRRGVALTRAGHLVVVSSLALLAIGWYLRPYALLALGAIGLVLVALAAARTASARPRVTVARSVEPAYVYSGAVSRVRLEVSNPTTRPSAATLLHDEVEGTAGATVQVGRLAPGARVTASYRLPTRRRGRYTVGPLAASLADPFGLTSRSGVAVAAAALVVFPPVVPLAPLPRTGGRDAAEGLGRARRLGHGDEFQGLRPYVPGDDLRSVHWPTSARVDDLVVRQHSQERRGMVTVLLDLRGAVHDGESLEAAISAAASVVVMLEAQGEAYRLITSGDIRTDHGTGPRHLRTCLELLAIAGPDSAVDLRAVATRLDRPVEESLVAILAGQSDTATAAVANLHFASAVAVVLNAPPLAQGAAPYPGVVRVAVPPGHNFAGAWNQAMREDAHEVAR
jgi:uncharacterized protein (DUF58 family)